MKTTSQRWWDIFAALCLFAALFCAALRLQATNWTENLGRVVFLVTIGTVLGLALGKSVFGGRTTFLMGLAFTLFFIPWQLGLLVPNMDWMSRLNIIYARLYYATADFLANKPVKDSILFLTAMMALYWLSSLLSGYGLARYANPWLPLVALGIMILVIEYTVEMYHISNPPGGIFSFLFLVFTLLLMGRIYFMRSRRTWETHGGTIEMEVGYDLGRGVVVAAVVIVFLAWNMPAVVNLFSGRSPASERVSKNWQTFKDRISKAVNTLRSPNPEAVQAYASNMFLGTGGSQSEEIEFTVKPQNGRETSRMYWDARSYDQYQNGQWLSTISDTRAVGPSSMPLPYPSWIMRQPETFTFTTQIPLLKTLYFTNAPLEINRSAQAVLAQAQDGAVDLNAIMVDPPLKAGDPYSVRALVAEPTILALRQSTTDYPDWVKARYLQMPSGFSPRVIDLARQIAGDEKTPYDKAIAITQYLRRTITYSISIPQPPRNQDPLEWFLFDERAGFCNYYASAEVMMLRSLGVPARLVVGYAEGTWDEKQGAYVVRGKDSHAWPEVYFPQLGWIPFEPTVSQPLTSYPQGAEANNNSQSSGLVPGGPTFVPTPLDLGERRANALLNQPDQSGRGLRLPVWTVVLLVLLALIVILSFLEMRRRRTEDLPLSSWLEKFLDEHGLRTPDWLRRWSRRSLRTPMENLFSTVSFMLRVWGQKIDPALTPAEQVDLLVTVVPGVKDQAEVLLHEYQRAMYSQYPANTLRAQTAVKEIRSIGYRNWFMRLIGLES
jgi:transglutaminase-like putative cysteine protease